MSALLLIVLVILIAVAFRARIDWSPIKRGIGVCLLLNAGALVLILTGLWR